MISAVGVFHLKKTPNRIPLPGSTRAFPGRLRELWIFSATHAVWSRPLPCAR